MKIIDHFESITINKDSQCKVVTLRASYEQIYKAINVMRNEMDSYLHPFHEFKTIPFVFGHYEVMGKFIHSMTYNFLDQPVLDMRTGEINPPQQLELIVGISQDERD